MSDYGLGVLVHDHPSLSEAFGEAMIMFSSHSQHGSETGADSGERQR